MDGHFNMAGITGQRFVDRVVDDFINQVVQTALARIADIHGRTDADGFKALQHRDLACAVFGCGTCYVNGIFTHVARILPIVVL